VFLSYHLNAEWFFYMLFIWLGYLDRWTHWPQDGKI